ncbi:MAG: DinB family protein [Fimbriimonadia bacterium]|jgi:hypothetical protein
MGTLTDKLTRSLDAALHKSEWHSLAAALRGLSDADAEWIPARYKGFPWSKGSIREIVVHVAADMLVQHSIAFGDGSLDWGQALALPEVREGTLDAARRLLQRGANESLRTLANLKDDDLGRRVTTWGGKKMSAEGFFDMLIEHALYHAGQIRYIRCLIEGERG